MHPDRLRYLAGRHEQQRAVVSRDVRTDGTRVTLECGHDANFVPHVDPSSIKECGCRQCGEHFVRTSPLYAAEFSVITQTAAPAFGGRGSGR